MQEVIEILGLILRSIRRTDREACCVSPHGIILTRTKMPTKSLKWHLKLSVCLFGGSRLLVWFSADSSTWFSVDSSCTSLYKAQLWTAQNNIYQVCICSNMKSDLEKHNLLIFHMKIQTNACRSKQNPNFCMFWVQEVSLDKTQAFPLVKAETDNSFGCFTGSHAAGLFQTEKLWLT